MNKFNLKNINSIGIVKTSALGDIIWTIPLIRNLQKNLHNTKIYWIVDYNFLPLLDQLSNKKNLFFIPIKKPRSIPDYLKIRKKFKSFHFDLLFCTQTALRINLLYPFINANIKIGFDSIRSKDCHTLFIDKQIEYKKEHSLKAILGFSKFIGIKQNTIEFNFSFNKSTINWIKNFTKSIKKNIITIHPVASHPYRTWSPENYAYLIDKLNNKYSIQIILTGAKTDKSFIKRIKTLTNSNFIDLAGKTTLPQLAIILKYSKLIICPDSGPIHLAAALKTPAVGLYTAVPTEYTGPFGYFDLCVDKHPEAVQKFIKKRKFFPKKIWNQRINHPDIMNLITIDEVLKKISKVI